MWKDDRCFRNLNVHDSDDAFVSASENITSEPSTNTYSHL